MGLFDGYFDPHQFADSGGLLGRLLSLQPQQQDQPDAGFGLAPPAPQPPRPNLASQYRALRPILGDHSAMLATVHPEVSQALIAQALASPQLDNSANVVSAGHGLGGIRIPPMAPVPVPAIPDWWKAAGTVPQNTVERPWRLRSDHPE